MSGTSSNELDKRKRRGKRGSTDNERRLDAFRKAVGTTEASWGDCDPKLQQSVIVAITGLGGAITFGLSRDNGAHSVTLMLDGERETLWFNGSADLDDALKVIIGSLLAMT